MLAIVYKRMAHFLQDSEQLLKVVILGRSNHIIHFVKLVLVVARNSGGDITRNIQGGTITLPHQHITKLLFLAVDNLAAFVVFQQLFFLQFFADLLHFLAKLRFPGINIKSDTQASVDRLVLFNAQITKLLPQGQGLWISALHSSKICTGLVMDCGIFFGILVNFHVDVKEMHNRVFFQFFFRPVLVKSNSKNTILLTPVTEVINCNHFVPQRLVQILEEISDNRRAQMPSVERFGDIWRRVFHNDRTTVPNIKSAKCVTTRENILENIFRRQRLINIKNNERLVVEYTEETFDWFRF
mmetsp:Transcript_34874/g.98400  ORF Transcript_34874/g.98400 Transcript_34874/m.98400 type:complete len:298 (+) Transcript_34874:796-1689(+)